jgi:hypothetical protein
VRGAQGKYFQIEFSLGGVPDGGKISNFLLEKVTVRLCMCVRQIECLRGGRPHPPVTAVSSERGPWWWLAVGDVSHVCAISSRASAIFTSFTS